MISRIRVLGLSIVLACILGSCNLIARTPEAGEEGRGTETPPSARSDDQLSARADRDGVVTISGAGQRQPLVAPGETIMSRGDGIDVDESGRAILTFPDLFAVEVLREGALTIQELAVDERQAIVTIFQNGGVLLNDFDPQREIQHRLTIQTEFATITATGTRFMVVREAGSPLEWIVGLDAAEGDLEVSADGITKSVLANQARWIAPIGEPSEGIDAIMGNVNDWIASLRGGVRVREFGETVWAQADAQATTEQLSAVPPPGETFELARVALRLGTIGSYSLEDCNADGIQDLAIRAGSLEMDFRRVLSRVRALDVVVVNRAAASTGGLIAFDPGRGQIASTLVQEEFGALEVLSLRSENPFHYGELALQDGCFLGFSLTPPKEDGTPGDPRSPVAGGGGPFIRIDTPSDGSSDTVNGFLLTGVSTVPFERNLVLRIETPDGEPLQEEPLLVEGGDFGGPPGVFAKQVFVDYNLPAELRVVVKDISAEDGSVLAEDSVMLTPLLPVVEVAERPPGNGRMVAVPVGAQGFIPEMDIDGDLSEWQVMKERSGVAWTFIDTIVFDRGCIARHPLYPEPPPVDFSGLVYFAYDQDFLYVAFQAFDEGFVGYSGADERYYRGDAPQLLLDIDLAGDFNQMELSPDDLQVDLLPGIKAAGDAPRAALWRLDILESRMFSEAQVASRGTETGYLLEAALPWKSLGFAPTPGARLGVAASISDNDTPDTDVQECMISTAPQRDFRDPTTWGTLLLVSGL